MRQLRSDRTGISYLSTGAEDEPLVICLHGFPDIPRTWAPLTDHLRGEGYRVVSPWLPGYAPSPLEGPFDIPTVARTTLSLVDELSPSDPVRIVGHDWGSVIVQYALAAWPERFRAAAALAVPHVLAVETNFARYPRELQRSAYIALFQVPIVSDRIVKLRNYHYIERLWRTWSPGFDPGADYFDEIKSCLRASMPAPLKYYRAMTLLHAIRQIRETLAAGPILVPTIYLHGERDGCIGREIAEDQEAHFSALFEMVRLADAGHFLHLERPAEVNAAISRWFEAH
ncbi:MAG: alpha/beta hydrolase [Myxococcales bacterium]|nr:MAG: alpha/beta hydrolase [Myxococcales bacterium]